MVTSSDQTGARVLGSVSVSVLSMRPVVGLLMLATLTAFGIWRSARTTRLDSFTLDEYYHIAAGISYVRSGDYRVNPEHPPLVKLWIGRFFPVASFHLPPLPSFTDKT